MLRQIVGCILSFLGIMLSFVFWYEIIPLGPKFIEWQRNPEEVLKILACAALFGGFSCLFLSRHIANWAMRVDFLPLETPDPEVDQAVMALQNAVRKLELKFTPQLGIYEQPEINAYIVGLTGSRSTLVLSRGALQTLPALELETLIGRELLHFKSGDLLAIAMMEGMLFAFSLYVARMLAFLLGTSLRQTEEEATSSDGVEMLVTGGLILLLTLPGALVFWLFSRSSALRADARVSEVLGKTPYLNVLTRLSGQPAPRREIFSDAFKFQSRQFPLTWLSLQPNLSLRMRHLST